MELPVSHIEETIRRLTKCVIAPRFMMIPSMMVSTMLSLKGFSTNQEIFFEQSKVIRKNYRCMGQYIGIPVYVEDRCDDDPAIMVCANDWLEYGSRDGIMPIIGISPTNYDQRISFSSDFTFSPIRRSNASMTGASSNRRVGRPAAELFLTIFIETITIFCHKG